MKRPLPPDVEFHEDIGLLIYRPRGSRGRAAINKIISLIGELEFILKKPFNRFVDAAATDAVDLNVEYIRGVSLYRRRFYGNRPPIKTAILATDSTIADYGWLHASLTQGSPDQRSRFPKPQTHNGSVSQSRCYRRKEPVAKQLNKEIKHEKKT